MYSAVITLSCSLPLYLPSHFILPLQPFTSLSCLLPFHIPTQSVFSFHLFIPSPAIYPPPSCLLPSSYQPSCHLLSFFMFIPFNLYTLFILPLLPFTSPLHVYYPFIFIPLAIYLSLPHVYTLQFTYPFHINLSCHLPPPSCLPPFHLPFLPTVYLSLLHTRPAICLPLSSVKPASDLHFPCFLATLTPPSYHQTTMVVCCGCNIDM